MDNKAIRKTIKKVQFQEDPIVATHDELVEMNDNLDKTNDKLKDIDKSIKDIEKVDLKPVIKQIEQGTNETVEAINDLQPGLEKVGNTLNSVGKVLEELAKIRGSKFLGIFKDENELPEDAQEGDFAILETNGELWYV